MWGRGGTLKSTDQAALAEIWELVYCRELQPAAYGGLSKHSEGLRTTVYVIARHLRVCLSIWLHHGDRYTKGRVIMQKRGRHIVLWCYSCNYWDFVHSNVGCGSRLPAMVGVWLQKSGKMVHTYNCLFCVYSVFEYLG